MKSAAHFVHIMVLLAKQIFNALLLSASCNIRVDVSYQARGAYFRNTDLPPGD